jgi:hypothetical protein
MAGLTGTDKRRLERLFGMATGYVLNFTNNTFSDFVKDSVGRSIYDKKYNNGSGSKANQLRGFWKVEPNAIVAKLLGDLIEYAETDLHQDDTLACRKIVARLTEASPVAELDAIAQIGDEHDLEIVARAVRESIDKNEPALGLDRLHTFATKFLRALCDKHGLATDRSEPLNSIYGKYVKKLRDDGYLESKMTASILKSVRAPLEAFNQVRNDQSLAHDNPLLNHDEALLIFNHVTSTLRFLRDLEQRLDQKEHATKPASASAPPFDDEIPL